jgi:hypothetical protein
MIFCSPDDINSLKGLKRFLVFFFRNLSKFCLTIWKVFPYLEKKRAVNSGGRVSAF